MITLTAIPPVDIPLKVHSPSTAEERAIPSSIPTPLPDWLSTAPDPNEQTRLPTLPRTRAQVLMEESVFEAFMERFLDAVTINDDPIGLVRTDPRNINLGRFMRWLHKNPEYYKRFEEAQKIAADIAVYQNDTIAEGADSLEDIERSKLRIRQNEFKATRWNKPKYGDSKQVDINMNAVFDFRAALEKREEQLRALEGEFKVVHG